MTPIVLAKIHAAAFVHERGWTEQEFLTFANDPLCTIYTSEAGFALTRAVAGEAELLTLAVHPDARRKGQAEQLMQQWLAAEQAKVAFLEVAADNIAALALYQKTGFSEIARRTAYYPRETPPAVDAILMKKPLT